MNAAGASGQADFLEIEHKFLMPKTFDTEAFAAKVLALKPASKTAVREVKDTYYVSPSSPNYIFRHRYDEQLQHLTAKSFHSLTSDRQKFDTEVRTEINLFLSQEQGDQADAVEAFL